MLNVSKDLLHKSTDWNQNDDSKHELAHAAALLLNAS
jgi:hypothetical protein